MKEIEIKNFNENVIDLIGKEWMLITAGSEKNYNTMTVSWGSVGFLWGKPVVMVYIRPQRYTLQFIDREESFSLSFFSEEYRSVLNLCGKRSGRDTDKASEAGITPFSPASGIVSFKEARLIIKCKKLFKTHLKSEDFIDKSIVSKWYSENDLHYMFVAEIENIWAK